MTRILHVSDLHFGAPSEHAQVEALERIVETERFDAVVVSGDLTQRTRTREFREARKFLDHARAYAPLIVVPGNHDVAWWTAPVGLGNVDAMFARYRANIQEELEPVLRVDGATFVGLNSAHGIQPFTLTRRPRDLSVVGAIRPAQWSKARNAFSTAPSGDLRVLVMHHNLLRGKISNRWGLANRALGIQQAALTGADLVLCGHDHEARIEQLPAAGKRMVVSTASTLTDRVRGGHPSSLNVIEANAASLNVSRWEWTTSAQSFVPGRAECFTR